MSPLRLWPRQDPPPGLHPAAALAPPGAVRLLGRRLFHRLGFQLASWVRLCGGEAGPRTWIAPGTRITDPALLTLGIAAFVDDGVVLETRRQIGHLVLIDRIVIGDEALIGTGSVLGPGVEVGAQAVVPPGSQVPPGTRIPAGTVWRGKRLSSPPAPLPTTASLAERRRQVAGYGR